MATKIQCPKCGTVLDLPAAGAGQVPCPGCGASLALPGAPPPIPPGPSGKPRSAAPLVTLGAVAAGVVVVGLLVAAVFMQGGSSALSYLPHESTVVGVVNVPAVLQSGFFRNVRSSEQFKSFETDFQEHTGLTVDEIAKVWFATPLPKPGGNVPAGVGRQAVFVIECTRPVDSADFIKRMQTDAEPPKEETVGKATIHCGPNVAYCFPQPRIIVAGSPDALRATLDPARPAGLNDRMQGVVKSLDTGRAVAIGAVMPSEVPDLPPGAAVPPDVVKKVDAATLHADVGADLLLRLVLFCKDGDTAESLRKMAEGLVEMAKQNQKMPPEARELLESIAVKSSGTEVEGSVKISGKLVDKAIEEGVPGTPFGPSRGTPAPAPETP